MRQAAGDHRFVKLGPRRDAQAAVVVERALAALGDEQVFVRRVVNQAGDDGAFAFERDRDRKVRDAVEEIGGAVERIDDPAVRLVRAFMHAAFLAEEAVAGARLLEVVAQHPLGAAVRGGDEIARPLQRNLQMLDLAEVALEAAPGAPGRFDHDVDDGGVLHGVRVRGAARAVKPAAGDTGGEGRNSAQNSHSPLQSPATVIEIAGSSPAMTSVIVLAM